MYTNRISYVAIYHGKHVINKLQNLPVDVAYISTKQHYAVVYFDKSNEEMINKQVKSVKGLKHFGPSQTYDQELNF
ncbi:MAG: DUF2129 domain-containing protein [Acholeplasmataceae bacterium]|nr:DUF2129 domain-containing protein [Acholeplasmataceae bacterium]